MRRIVVSAFIVLAVVSAEAAVTVFNDSSGDGLWGTATNWSIGSVPDAAANAVINNGRVATIATDAPLVDIVTVGNGPVSNTTLFIEANLTANRFRVSWSADALGAVHQSNGVVTINNILRITSTVPDPQLGTYTLHGGSLIFSNVDFEIGKYGPGCFTVDGSLPVAIQGRAMSLGSQAKLVFDLDTLGVTPVTLSDIFAVDSSSRLLVDGTDYEGLDGYFPLVLAPTRLGSFDPANVTFTGFGAREPALVAQADGLWLRVLAPPAMSDRLLSLVPESTVAPDYANTHFSATRSLDPSGSPWSLALNEAHVMDTRLTQDVLGGGPGTTNRSWELRVAQNGSVYSLRTPALGETVPPSWRSNGDASAWNDEVWQTVSVASGINDPPESPYFMHQSGVYWYRDEELAEPFYSPQVAAELDETNRSFTTINWTPQAHIQIYTNASASDDWKSYQLVYARYRDLGQGLIEATLGMYNYGPDLISWINAPWGGVRRTSMEYAFLSGTNGTTWTLPPTGSFGSHSPTNFNHTGGWVAFSAAANGTTPSLGLVFGKDASPLPDNSVGASWYRWGYAGGRFQSNETNWRNYFVSSNIRRYRLFQGKGIWTRYYFVLGDDLSDVSSRIAARSLVDVELREFDYRETTTPLVGYSLVGSGTTFRVFQDSRSPEFFLYAHPVNSSFPVFEIIKNDYSRTLTWNPYSIGFVKPYDGTLAGIRLLGFALRSTHVNLEGTTYLYHPLANVMAAVSGNYIADGEALSVRVPTPIQAWRLKHFGLSGNEGPAANEADPEGDGMVNLWEYALGGVPTNGGDVGLLPTAGIVSNGSFHGLEYVYRRRVDAAARGLTYRVEALSNLVFSMWTTNGCVEVGAAPVDAEFESVTNRIDVGDTTFGRLRIDFEE